MTGRRVLIVEDEPIVQLHLQRIVAQAGHVVCGTASTTEQAIESAEVEAPELVLMDVRLPGERNGLEAARILRDRHDCAVVFATAFADDLTVAKAGEVEAAGFVSKPFSGAEIRAAIGSALGRHDSIDRIRSRERFLATILESMDTAVLMADARGRIRFANARAGAVTGWSEEEAAEREISEVLRFASEEDARLFRTRWAATLRGDGSDRIERMEIVSRDGKDRLVDIELRPSLDHVGLDSDILVSIRERAQTTRPSTTSRTPGAHAKSSPRRVLMYSHDTLGLGHLQRSMNLMRAMLERDPSLSILLVTGSPVVHLYDLPRGADYVKLPAVRKVGSERYEARSLFMPDAGVRALRSNLLLRTVRDFEPNLFVVDHAPIGMAGEVLPTLEFLRGQSDCTTLLGLRDIIDDPTSVIEDWNRKGIYGVLNDLYDRIFVYGARSVYDSVSRYQIPPSIAAKMDFVHYVCETEGATDPDLTRPNDMPVVAVSIGGGDGGANEVIFPFLEMLRRFRSEIDFHTSVLTGPLLPVEQREKITDLTHGLPVDVRKFVSSTAPLFSCADLVVSTCGYNTMAQLLACARRGIVIPRAMHRKEQIIRARCMEGLGLVNCLESDQTGAEMLFESVRSALKNREEPLSSGRARGIVPLDGSGRASELAIRLVRSRDTFEQVAS